MVCQSGSPIFQENVNKQTYQRLKSLFPAVNMYVAVVPTYPGGLWSFTLASKRYETSNPDKVKNKDTYYVNENIVESCFALPAFVHKRLNE